MTAKEFRTRMETRMHEMLDVFDNTGDLPEDCESITVTWGGLTISLPMHADNYEALDKFMGRMIENEEE